MSIWRGPSTHFGGTEFQRIDAENRFKIAQKLKFAEGTCHMLTVLLIFLIFKDDVEKSK